MVRRLLSIGGLLALIVAVNPATVGTWASMLGAPHLLQQGAYLTGQVDASVWVLDIWVGVTIGFLVFKAPSIGHLLRQNGLYLLLSLIACLLFMLGSNPILAGKVQWLRVLLPLAQLWLTAKLFHLKFVKAAEGSPWARLRSVGTVLTATLAIGFVLEAVFMFVAKTSLNDNSLASKVWFARHWETNSSGYRDSESDTDLDLKGRKLLLIGDSFLAGHGVQDTADRFSNLLQSRLDPSWHVLNFGQNGANVRSAHAQLSSYKAGADLVVLCWFVNDMEGCGDPLDPETPKTPAANLQPPGPFSVRHGSYLVNFFDHLIPHADQGTAYLDYLHRAYQHPGSFGEHERWLQRIQENAQFKGARFAVVLFPMLNAVDASDFALSRMRSFWQQRDVPCLDLSPVFRPHPASALTVNAQDAHPNPFAHGLAANALWNFLMANGLLDQPEITPQRSSAPLH